MPDVMLIRPATTDDAAELAALQLASWLEAYRGIMPDHVLDALSETEFATAWNRKLSEPARRDLAGLLDGRIVGFISFGPCRDPGAEKTAGEILGLYVHPEFWDCGYGKELCAAAMNEMAREGLDPVTLWVLQGNRRACRFYEKAGFSLNGKTKTVTRDGAQLPHVQYEIEMPRG